MGQANREYSYDAVAVQTELISNRQVGALPMLGYLNQLGTQLRNDWQQFLRTSKLDWKRI